MYLTTKNLNYDSKLTKLTKNLFLLFIFFSFFLILLADEYDRLSNDMREKTSENFVEHRIEQLQPIHGIFLLILAVAGNFIAEVMGCKTQKLLSENMFAKNFIVILLIYFSIGFASSNKVSPFSHFRRSILIWFFFIIFNKMTPTITNITFLLLLSILILKNWIDYYTTVDEEENNAKIDTCFQLINMIFKIILVIMCIGFFTYLIKQYSEYKDTYEGFDINLFLFGKVKCAEVN